MSEPTSTTSESRARRAANLFDLRRVIGGLFVVYGLLLAILGLFDSDADIDRAAGVNINLYGGWSCSPSACSCSCGPSRGRSATS